MTGNKKERERDRLRERERERQKIEREREKERVRERERETGRKTGPTLYLIFFDVLSTKQMLRRQKNPTNVSQQASVLERHHHT